MHALYHRSPFPEENIVKLVCPLLTSDGIALLTRLLQSLRIDPEAIDERKYAMLKKLSEVSATSLPHCIV